MEKIDLFIYGAGGHGKVVRDIAYRNGFEKIAFIDDNKDRAFRYESYLAHYQDAPVALGIGDNAQRYAIFEKLKKDNVKVLTLIDPSALIGSGVRMGEGVVVMPYAIVNADTTIEDGAILNSACVVEHDNLIGSFCHISPNATLGGGVEVGSFCHIGIGSTILPRKRIGSFAIVGAGAVVTKDIEARSVVVGVPAKEI